MQVTKLNADTIHAIAGRIARLPSASKTLTAKVGPFKLTIQLMEPNRYGDVADAIRIAENVGARYKLTGESLGNLDGALKTDEYVSGAGEIVEAAATGSLAAILPPAETPAID